MSSIRPGRLSRPAAERLLDDVPAGRSAGGDPLASMLAAAAAPPHAAEQAGEDAAVTAFRAEHLVPASNSGRGQMIKSPLAKILTMKAGALALALSAGGVAVAATTGAFSNSSANVQVPSSASAGVSTGSQSGSQSGVKASVPATHTNVSASGQSGTPSAGSILSAVGAGQACRQLANTVTATVAHTDASAVGVLTETGVQNALDNPALSQVVNNPTFVSLIATAEGRGNVADYCGLTMHLTRLASPSKLPDLPAAVLTAIPASVMSQIPASALSGVPAADLSRLPISFLSRLPVPVLSGMPTSVLSGLPAPVLAKLPVSTLKGVLPSLPAGSLAQLPTKVLAGAMAQLPASTLTGVVTKLPASVRSKTLPLLPTSLLSGLPKSLLSGLPGLGSL